MKRTKYLGIPIAEDAKLPGSFDGTRLNAEFFNGRTEAIEKAFKIMQLQLKIVALFLTAACSILALLCIDYYINNAP